MKPEHFEIQARQQLSESDLAAIRELENICNEHEGLKLKLNWDMLYGRQPGVTDDFLCFDNSGQLVGYLALYSFGRPEAEVSGMVHPLYRRSGAFSKLLQRASDECGQRGIKSLLFINDRNSSSGIAFLKSYDTVFDHSEHKMERPGSIGPIELNSPIVLRKAGTEDFVVMVKLGAICFDSTEEEARAYYSDDHLLPTDELYVSVLDGKVIGVLKLCKEKDDILVYGFGIHPDYRGKGYGRITLSRAVNAALEHKPEPEHVALEVDCVNDTALSLYISCGFKTTATYDYYRLPL